MLPREYPTIQCKVNGTSPSNLQYCQQTQPGTRRPTDALGPGLPFATLAAPARMDSSRGAGDNDVMTPAQPSPRPCPQSLTDLFISFTLLALQGFGGVLAVVQRELVERKGWLTQDEFIEDWAVAQIMPGPNVVNLSMMIGGRYFGLKGALTALAGMLTVPLVVILLLALIYARFAHNPEMAGALRGMGAVAAGLIAATGMKLMGTLKNNPLGRPLCAVFGVLCFVAVALLHLPLAYVLAGLGVLATGLAFRRLRP